MRNLLAGLLTVLTLAAAAEEGWEGRVSVPARVHYKQADTEQNRPTVDKVKDYFNGNQEQQKLSEAILISGPFLWGRLGSRPEWRGQGIPSTTKVDGLKLEGRAFHKDPVLAGKLLAELRRELKADGGFKVRKLNLAELDLLWSLWGFDELNDPLLLLESPHHRLVLIFVQGDLMQVDDFYQAALPKSSASSKGAHPFVQQTARQFWSGPPHNVKADQLVSGEGIQILSDDDTIHESLTTDQFIEYTKACLAARQKALAQAGKTPRNLSLQIELRPDGDFFTVVCDPPLGTELESKLKQALSGVPHPPLRSTVALQLFCRVWGGKHSS
jgi:hypothetical protein